MAVTNIAILSAAARYHPKCIEKESLQNIVASTFGQKLLSVYRKRARQRPMTSPWHTSSALNSEPSSVR